MNRALSFAAIGCAFLVVTMASAADPRDRFEPRTYTDQAGDKLNYRLLKPKDYDAAKKYPLVLFFHGAGERGKDNTKQLVHGMKDFASDGIMEKYPAFVIAPQCPDGLQWVDTPWTADEHTMPEQPTKPLQQSLELVAALQKEYSIDPARIYVTGLSMGGFGTWDAIQRQPNLFAAAAPICGGGDAKLADKMKHVPIWLFHGDKDTVVKPKRSRDMLAALKAAGATNVRYTEYPGVGHDSWSATYRDAALYEWLFDQKKN